MTIRAATKFAIVGVSVGSLMYIAGPFLSKWAVQLSSGSLDRLMGAYYVIAEIFQGGALVLFFVTLNSKQKAKAKDDGRP